MSEPAEINERFTRLEAEVADVRYLARGADEDTSVIKDKLHAHIMSLESLRETQIEHGERLGRLERKVDDGFDKIDGNFTLVEVEFGKVHAGIDRITGLLTDKPEET